MRFMLLCFLLFFLLKSHFDVHYTNTYLHIKHIVIELQETISQIT